MEIHFSVTMMVFLVGSLIVALVGFGMCGRPR